MAHSAAARNCHSAHRNRCRYKAGSAEPRTFHFRHRAHRSAHPVNPARLAGPVAPAANPDPGRIDPDSAHGPEHRRLVPDSHSNKEDGSRPEALTSAFSPEAVAAPDLAPKPAVGEADPVTAPALGSNRPAAVAPVLPDPAVAVLAGPAKSAAGPAAAPIRRAPVTTPDSEHTPCAKRSPSQNPRIPNSLAANFPAKNP